MNKKTPHLSQSFPFRCSAVYSVTPKALCLPFSTPLLCFEECLQLHLLRGTSPVSSEVALLVSSLG